MHKRQELLAGNATRPHHWLLVQPLRRENVVGGLLGPPEF
jgi:hypothetical protein